MIRRTVSLGHPEPGAYRLVLGEDAIVIEAEGEPGFFYAGRTLGQIRRQHPRGRLPRLEILDWPAYPVRGFYHDVARGKVPTRRELLRLAQTCADWKLNHLELYVEHSFAFKNHPEVWRGADPLTAEDIRALDARCAELHIDLVPSFSTFGHFHGWIRDKFPELNELERDVSGDPFHYWDRMMHYTLDCRDPRSLRLVREIITETRPLFRSRFYNICCDETFDLGRGKNQELAARVGKGRLYVDFLKSIMRIVREAGAVPLFWGDILRKHPEYLAELPRECVVLDWDYGPALRNSAAADLARKGRTFYVCSGTQGWNRWLPHYARAHANITRLARHGREHGAAGHLLTDWGDYAHIGPLGPVLPLLALGASAAWNPASSALSARRFGEAASRTVLGDASGRLFSLLAAASRASRGSWQMISWCHLERTPTLPADWFDDATGLPNGFFDTGARVHRVALARLRALAPRVRRLVKRSRPADALVKDELTAGLLGLLVFEELHLAYLHRAGRARRQEVRPGALARRVDELALRVSRVWRKRNRPSELYRLLAILRAIAETLRGPAGAQPVKARVDPAKA